MTETLPKLLLQLSEAGEPALLWGRQAAPYTGRAFDRLLDHGVLVELAPATEWDVCPACKCGHECRPIQRINGELVATCPFDSGSDTLLDEVDVRAFQINLPALVRTIGADSGFDGHPSEVAAGVWHLGPNSTGRQVFIAFSPPTLLQNGLFSIARVVARSSPITFIGPPLPAGDQLRFVEGNCFFIEACECLLDGTATFALADCKLDPPPALHTRLHVDRTEGSVFLDGVVKSLSPQSFKLLVLLAEQALATRAVVERRQIEQHLWGASIHRMAIEVREPIRALRNALTAGSPDPTATRLLIANGRNPNGYRLVLRPEEIQLGPQVS